MPNIVLARIDNRLVHGQVGNSWVGATGANLVIVADDEVANDPIQKQVMKMTTDSAGIGIRFFSVQKTIDVIGKAAPRQKIFIVVKTPHVMRQLVEGGVPLKEVDVGNMHYSEGKREFHEEHVYVDDQDVADLEAIKAAGVAVYIQIAPNNRRIDL